MGLIDSHAHLTHPDLLVQIVDILGRCDESAVDRVITIGTDLPDARKALELRDQYPDRISAAAGFHPHEAAKVNAEDLAAMAELWRGQDVVAIGEIGLDYHYDFANPDIQKRVLEQQLEASSELDHPLIIHCRDAMEDAVALLTRHGYDQRPVVFHCFTGTAVEAALLARHGWRISFTGIVTFRKSTWLQEIAAAYPSDLIMVETDSPYLSPEPLRGRHPNEPARVRHTAQFLAKLRGVAEEEFFQLTCSNTQQFFNLPSTE